MEKFSMTEASTPCASAWFAPISILRPTDPLTDSVGRNCALARSSPARATSSCASAICPPAVALIDPTELACDQGAHDALWQALPNSGSGKPLTTGHPRAPPHCTSVVYHR